jgi:hypothetical protein
MLNGRVEIEKQHFRKESTEKRTVTQCLVL